jgi:hypothetical protein
MAHTVPVRVHILWMVLTCDICGAWGRTYPTSDAAAQWSQAHYAPRVVGVEFLWQNQVRFAVPE